LSVTDARASERKLGRLENHAGRGLVSREAAAACTTSADLGIDLHVELLIVGCQSPTLDFWRSSGVSRTTWGRLLDGREAAETTGADLGMDLHVQLLVVGCV
jgi:hypothetical protein